MLNDRNELRTPLCCSSPPIFHLPLSSYHLPLILFSLPPFLAFCFYYARRLGGGVGVAGRPPIHMVRSRIDMPSGRAMWCTTLAHPTHYAAAISSYSISDHLSCLLPRPFLSASSFPPHLLFLAASIPAPRLLATSPSRLLLACGCSSPWAASAGAPPPPQKTYGQVDRASEMSPGRLRATAHIYGIGCCSPPRQPPTHLQPVDSQSVTLPLSWCSSTPQTSGHRTTRYCCMMMSFNLLSHFRLPHRPLLLHDDVI